jgi:hypothetical protein
MPLPPCKYQDIQEIGKIQTTLLCNANKCGQIPDQTPYLNIIEDNMAIKI